MKTLAAFSAWLMSKIWSLGELNLDDPAVRFEWARPVPAWGWAVIILAAFAIGAFAYRKLLGTLWVRITLASLRAVTLILLAILFSGPRLVRQSETIEKDWAVLLADRSLSMTLRDVAGGASTREQQLQDDLRAIKPAADALAKDRNLLRLGFDAGVFDLPQAPTSPLGVDLAPPAGRRTLINQALDQTLRQLAARPVAGIVLLTDGATPDPPQRELLRALKSRQIPVFPVALGSTTPPTNLSITRADAPTAAFLGDIVPVSLRLNAVGKPPAGTVIRLLDASGKILDERPFPDITDTDAAITLAAKPDHAGELSWTATIVSPVPDAASADDTATVSLSAIDRPIHVLLLDGYPRWEYRYLKNLLVRERSIVSSATLLAPDRRFIQEGSEPLVSLPRTRTEWAKYDVVIIGDLRPEILTPEQLTLLRDHVSREAGGLLWIGGPGHTPSAWRGSALADLLPFTLGVADGGGTAGITTWLDPVNVRPTPLADSLQILRLSDDGTSWPTWLDDAAYPWAALRWAQRIDPARLKPAAQVIANAVDSAKPDQSAPLVITMRYGAGRTLYIGTDETWRWRLGRGETLPERFWLPLIRLLAREGLSRSGKAAFLDAAPNQPTVDQPVRFTLTLLDQSLQDSRPASLALRIRNADAPASTPPAATLELRPDPADRDQDGRPSSTFSALWIPDQPGHYRAEPADPLLSGFDLAADVRVTLPDDELRNPKADHALLTSIAEQTGGRVLSPEDLPHLADILPNREVRLLGTPEIHTLWDKPASLVLFLVLICLEWVIRRLIKLP